MQATEKAPGSRTRDITDMTEKFFYRCQECGFLYVNKEKRAVRCPCRENHPHEMIEISENEYCKMKKNS